MIYLNNISDYSIGKSLLTIDDILLNASHAVGINFSNHFHGIVSFYFKAKYKNIKPIFLFEYDDIIVIPRNFKAYSKYIQNPNKYLNNSDFIKIIKSNSLVEGANVFYASNKAELNSVAIPKINCAEKDIDLCSRFIEVEQKQEYSVISIQNTYKIADMVDIVFPSIKNYEIANSEAKIKTMLKIADRTNYELDIIKEKNFTSYFLLVKDILDIANQNNILIGPGRGSVAASRIAYELGIIKFDPLQYNLIFERFLNKARQSLADIDIDVDQEKRSLLIEKIREKYDALELYSFSKYSKSSAEIEIRKRIPYGNIEQYVSLLEGKISGKTKHPAGIIISNIREIVYCCSNIAHIDVKELELLQGLKIDILPLKTLTILNKLLNITNLKISDIDLNDSLTYERLLKDSSNVFQLESESARKILQRIEPKNIERLADVLAMNRPLTLRNSQIIYQEQLIQLVREHGFSLSEAELIVRNISKKKRIKFKLSQSLINKIETTGAYLFNKAHAVAYAHLSYYIAFFKANYPIEFEAVFRTSILDANFSELKVKKIGSTIFSSLLELFNQAEAEAFIKERALNGPFWDKKCFEKRANKSLLKSSPSLVGSDLLFPEYNYKIGIAINKLSDKEKKLLKAILVENKGSDINVIFLNISNKAFKISFGAVEKLQKLLGDNLVMLPID